MTIQEISTLVHEDPAYDFLRTDPVLRGRDILFIALGGSYAYGTNVDTSDVDLRGAVLNRPEELIGLQGFDQFTHPATDTVIYSFKKLVPLLMNCNPNVIELLGCRKDHYLSTSPAGIRMSPVSFPASSSAFAFISWSSLTPTLWLSRASVSSISAK